MCSPAVCGVVPRAQCLPGQHTPNPWGLARMQILTPGYNGKKCILISSRARAVVHSRAARC